MNNILKDKRLPKKVCSLVAKCSQSNDKQHLPENFCGYSYWLPLWMHMLDTAGVLEYLVKEWLPSSAKSCLAIAGDLDNNGLCALARFLGMTHDFGKATPLFQMRIAESFNKDCSVYRRWLNSGLCCNLNGVSLADRKDAAHALAGQALLLRKQLPAGIASVIGAHHGRPTVKKSKDCELLPELGTLQYLYFGRKEQQAAWKEIHQELADWCWEQSGCCDIWNSFSEMPILSETAMVLWSGLLIFADWVASNETYFQLLPDTVFPEAAADYYPERIERGLAEFAPSEPWTAGPPANVADLYALRFGFAPNVMQLMTAQAAAASENPGLFVIEAQMGQGKTEAALAAAEIAAHRSGAGGMFFGLPTQATTNAMFSRIKKWGEKLFSTEEHSVRLAHGLAELNADYAELKRHHGVLAGTASVDDDNCDSDKKSSLYVHQWFTGRKQVLLSDFVIGTVDQLLLAALRQKHVMLRHVGLAGKVVVVDEVHAYDAYMNKYLDMALTWLGAYQVPVILLSATLPAERRKELVEAYVSGRLGKPFKDGGSVWGMSQEYPLLTYTDGAEVKQIVIPRTASGVSVVLEHWQMSFEDSADRLCREFKLLPAGGCAGIIVNTVKRAQKFYEAVKQALPEHTVLLYHASFLAPDRLIKETKIQELVGKHSKFEQRDRVIVIGTQVLEQSLDIDFDIMASDLCPIDLLLQRLGRLHRHKRDNRPAELSRPRCIVLDGDDNEFELGAVKIYGEYMMMRTRAFLPEKLVLPDDISPLVQKVYGEQLPQPLPEGYGKAKDLHDTAREKSQGNAKIYRLQAPSVRHKDLHSLLSDGLQDDNDQRCLATVREGEASIEVLALRDLRSLDGNSLACLCKDCYFNCQERLSEELTLEMARQRLRLPLAFTFKRDMALRELEAMTETLPAHWRESALLQGELYLLFDENYSARLAGYLLNYSLQTGLVYVKEDNDE